MTRPNQERSINIAAPTPGPVANAIKFNGAAYANSSAIGVDSKAFFVSCFFNIGTLADGAQGYILYGTGGKVTIERQVTANIIRVIVKTAGSALAIKMQSSTTYTQSVNTGWHHLVSWGRTTAGVQVSELYIDGVDVSVNPTNTADNIVDWSLSSYGYGSRDSSALNLWEGDVSNLFVESDESKLQSILTADAADVPALFRNSDGSVRSYPNESLYPYGTFGERPLGFQPVIYLPKPFGTYEENVGSFGDVFTIQAAGVIAATPPP